MVHISSWKGDADLELTKMTVILKMIRLPITNSIQIGLKAPNVVWQQKPLKQKNNPDWARSWAMVNISDNMLTFVLVQAVVTVLLPITPPGQRDALTAVSTLPLVFPAHYWWWHAVLDTNDETKFQPLLPNLKKSVLLHHLLWQEKLQNALSQKAKCSWSEESLPQLLLLLINTDLLHLTWTVFPYLFVWPVFAVIFAITEPLFLQADVAVRASELHRAARGSGAIHLIRAVAAVSISITSQSLRHALTTATAILVNRTGHNTLKEDRTLDVIWGF